ncbi:glycosyltransferase [Sphingobacterium griseoflavum]|uniref:Glycosyl transferase n=1 Tax=Sphingobacterium griseoflavum TaxID=1474952 RepID=A0ABQ3I2L8_9SPHI|nr:glycosyltransferase [Sphingobacterium griseoflavum]GHE43563.1 glycosyl transferase [Sphingobacterium griseoflavum]
MDKICFVVGLYGDEVNGGAEKHCKMLAEKAASRYQVEVLTSTTDNYTSFNPFYAEGSTVIDNVTVRRFKTQDFNPAAFDEAYKKSRWGRKIRRFLYKAGILKHLANIFPRFTFALKDELKVLKSHGLFSKELIKFAIENEHHYKAFFLLSYPNPNFFFINAAIAQKCVLIPTAHNEGDFFRSYLTHIFTTINHIAFNTEAERQLCRDIFGKKMVNNSILAVGTDLIPPVTYETISQKFKLPERYILYFGRIAKEKIGNLLQWFLNFKRISADPVKLVLTGGLFMDKVDHPDIIYTGFVTESEKTALIQHSQLVVNPSDRESLSLLLLETMQLGKPSLVNGKSEVLKQHCINSGFASAYYTSEKDFTQKLDRLLKLTHEQKKELGARCVDYIVQNYNWSLILSRLENIVEE